MEFLFIIVIILPSLYLNSVHSISSKSHDIRDLLRKKRSLLFPNPLESETKVQVLFGLGLPMEGEISMTLGYVLKCNYELPYNASDFNDGPYVRYVRSVNDDNKSESLTGSSKKAPGTMSRWSLYRMLEMFMETGGSTGKACLLRAVCEVAEAPFRNGRHGLLGEILHVVLTPSTTHEEYEMYSDREYRAAEIMGKNSDGEACRLTYPECLYNPLDYFTKKSNVFFS